MDLMFLILLVSKVRSKFSWDGDRSKEAKCKRKQTEYRITKKTQLHFCTLIVTSCKPVRTGENLFTKKNYNENQLCFFGQILDMFVNILVL